MAQQDNYSYAEIDSTFEIKRITIIISASVKYFCGVDMEVIWEQNICF